MSNTKAVNCIICEEKLNKTVHAVVTCEFCKFDACRTCCETYLLSQTDAKCMNTSCGKPWDRKFIVNAFPKSFVANQWKKHREKVLLDREIALLPATQSVVEDMIRREKIQKEVEEIEKQIRELRQKQHNLHYQENPQKQKQKTHFVKACPDPDCRGYLSSQWKCGLCENHACKKCHVLIKKDEENEEHVDHVCNPDEVATAKLLDKDTKSCPKCQTGIFKIEGCDQMWCTQCHTAFSWRTGEIETNIHNPHFYEWQRRTGGGQAPRNPGDIVCGREITHNMISELSRKLKPKVTNPNNESPETKAKALKVYDRASAIVRSILHLNHEQLVNYRTYGNENNLDLRVSYMRQRIDKDTFMQRVQRDNKKFEKKREIYNILTLFIQTVTDIMFRFQDAVNKLISYEDLEKILDEIVAIQEYSNECLVDISETYGSKAKKIEFYNANQNKNQYDNINVLV